MKELGCSDSLCTLTKKELVNLTQASCAIIKKWKISSIIYEFIQILKSLKLIRYFLFSLNLFSAICILHFICKFCNGFTSINIYKK